MKYMKQLSIVLAITFLGEILNKLLPFPIPGSIYGFIIMLLCLQFKIIKLEKIKDIADFLIDIMPIMFVPAVVGITVIWSGLADSIIQILLITISTTVLVMVATGKVAQFILDRDGGKDAGGNQ
ncbi:MAG TPA: CidA/LrgA family protein [Tissierellaceae bacterium]|nr:CidA/LrgA family protein [Tissierellaceae bacterium]